MSQGVILPVQDIPDSVAAATPDAATDAVTTAATTTANEIGRAHV